MQISQLCGAVVIFVQNETKAVNWHRLASDLTNVVGKLDSEIIDLYCCEKRTNWSEIVTCDMNKIASFIEFSEGCMNGFRAMKMNLVSLNLLFVHSQTN